MERESRAASADREGELNWLPCPGEQGRQLPSWPGLEGEGPGLEGVDSFEALVVSGHRALLPSFCCLHQPPPYLRVGSRIRRRPPRASVSPSIQCGLVTPHWVVVVHELIVVASRLRTASLVAQLVKNLPAMQETLVKFLGWEDLLEKR